MCSVGALCQEGLKPVIAGDIWGEGSISILGVLQYRILPDWTAIEELMVCAAPFSHVRHTADNVEALTKQKLVKAGVAEKPEDAYEGCHWKVSDNGSNMVKGWSGLPGGFCTAHTTELSSNIFLAQPEVTRLID